VNLDVRTGRITQFFTVSNWGEVSDDFEPVISRLDSRLIVFRGKRNENGVNGNHYYLIDDRGELKHLCTGRYRRRFQRHAESRVTREGGCS
jgi:hypothetical protein